MANQRVTSPSRRSLLFTFLTPVRAAVAVSLLTGSPCLAQRPESSTLVLYANQNANDTNVLRLEHTTDGTLYFTLCPISQFERCPKAAPNGGVDLPRLRASVEGDLAKVNQQLKSLRLNEAISDLGAVASVVNLATDKKTGERVADGGLAAANAYFAKSASDKIALLEPLQQRLSVLNSVLQQVSQPSLTITDGTPLNGLQGLLSDYKQAQQAENAKSQLLRKTNPTHPSRVVFNLDGKDAAGTEPVYHRGDSIAFQVTVNATRNTDNPERAGFGGTVLEIWGPDGRRYKSDRSPDVDRPYAPVLALNGTWQVPQDAPLGIYTIKGGGTTDQGAYLERVQQFKVVGPSRSKAAPVVSQVATTTEQPDAAR